MNPVRKVIIIGAGASGIAAATRLYEQGIRNILVIEAEKRIGGRIHTVDLPNDDGFVEFGAQWIHGEKNNVVFEMAAARNLHKFGDLAFKCNSVFLTSSSEILNREISDKLLEVFHQVTNDLNLSEAKRCLSTGNYYIPKLEEAFEKLQINRTSVNLKNEFIEWCHQMMNSIDGSDSWFDSSISTLEEYWECIGDQLTSWKSAGYRTIISLLMEKCQEISGDKFLEENILTNKPVRKIKLNNDVLCVECADGSIYFANHVIVTVSLGVLKEKVNEIFEDITVPEEKMLAFNNFGFGSVNKIFIKFRRQWLPENIQCLCLLWSELHKKQYEEQGLDWLTGLFALVRCYHAPNVLCGWIVGSKSRKMEMLGVDEIQTHVTTLLRKLLAERFDISEIEYCRRSTWSFDEHFKGAYSYRTAASEELGITSSSLFAPINNRSDVPVILFAGEATHPHYYSTVHGAIETGWREADRIISLKNI